MAVPASQDVIDLRDALWQLRQAAQWNLDAQNDESAACLRRALKIAERAVDTSRAREATRRQEEAARRLVDDSPAYNAQERVDAMVRRMKEDGEAAPEYVTVDDKEATGGKRVVAVIR